MKRMILSASAALCAALLSGCQESASIGVIGGADGPTAVFVSGVTTTGTAAPATVGEAILAGVVVAVAAGVGAWLLLHFKKKP